ncbi:uncharacterized protein CC84DRAFT_1179087 [Paraphaeosphaeria sporulosa]|uniref:Uncharacterized protein n=1 Tax=Paraphaeosphaeria sporulosa TaxID=1460663 RepID=A0A177C626_9PLEO|nr:uncharacterized protein CC84DRAFT_1179087 [Paraphaeosphaeria sporulosa]OAG02140.1 hypothetical protein CC84DRAFT_1179087 [Paraphaeosphaeria sporulosa]
MAMIIEKESVRMSNPTVDTCTRFPLQSLPYLFIVSRVWKHCHALKPQDNRPNLTALVPGRIAMTSSVCVFFTDAQIIYRHCQVVKVRGFHQASRLQTTMVSSQMVTDCLRRDHPVLDSQNCGVGIVSYRFCYTYNVSLPNPPSQQCTMIRFHCQK